MQSYETVSDMKSPANCLIKYAVSLTERGELSVAWQHELAQRRLHNEYDSSRENASPLCFCEFKKGFLFLDVRKHGSRSSATPRKFDQQG